MNGVGSYSKALTEVMSLWKEAKYDRALNRVEAMRKQWPGNAHLLTLWAQLLQLVDEPVHGLEDAKRALEQAVELDKKSPAAAIELGHFLDTVEDNPRAASRAFAQGIESARHDLIDGLLGQARSLLQLDKRDDAVRCLVEAMRLADAERPSMKGPFASRIEELLKDLGQMQSA